MSETTEAPMSVSTVVYYKGFSTTLTRRNLDALAINLIRKQFEDIDTLLEEYQGIIKPSWNPETNKVALDKDPDWIKEPVQPMIGTQVNKTIHTESTENLGNCSRCGAPNKLSKQGKVYCSNTCWLKK